MQTRCVQEGSGHNPKMRAAGVRVKRATESVGPPAGPSIAGGSSAARRRAGSARHKG